MRQRKSPRLNLRFDNFRSLDLIEIAANRQGLKIGPWAKSALLKQAKTESWREIFRDAAMFHVIECVFLLRELAGSEAQKRAFKEAKSFQEKVKNFASENFDDLE